ncbi:MAG: type IV pilus assembly protein PilF, partial [Neolewinella sp.]
MLLNQPRLKRMHRNSIFNRALLLIVLSASVVSCVTVDPQYEPWPENTRAQLHIDLGHIYLERRQPNVAKEEFNKALAIDEQSDQALHGLGLIEAQALDLDKAKDYFAKAVSLNSQNLKAVSDYAILTCRSGDTSSGITLLKRTQANSKKPDTMSMYLALGRCYQLAQENDLSAQALTRVLQINPKLPQALFSMAEIRF